MLRQKGVIKLKSINIKVMKYIRFFLLALLSVVTFSACVELPSVEPSKGDVNAFQRQVRKSMIKAVQSPGIDNGSLLVVTVDGDTLIAPKDSVQAATPSKIIYMELMPPRMPKAALSSKSVDAIMILAVIGMICVVILIAVIGVFRVMLSRQRQRNKIISEALEAGVQLPESFYTGQQTQAEVNYTIINGGDAPAATPASNPNIPDVPDTQTSSQPLPQMPKPAVNDNVRQLRQGIMLIGLGLVMFLGFAAAHADAVGIISGGCMMVVGVAKLATIYLANKL